MKYFIALVLTLFMSTAGAFDACMSGSWFDPDRNGEGITLEALPNGGVLGYFYTYGSQGRAWYVMTGDDTLAIFGTVKHSNDPFGVVESEVGTATVTTINAQALQFTYDLVLDVDRQAAIPWCLGNHCSGSHTYTRLTWPVGCSSP